jgi:UDP-N-acetylglucosamine 2-epimerase
MHKNPVVRESLVPVLGNHPQVRLIEPPEYEQFVKLMQRADLILSDSGGVQEEAPAFGIPVLVLRETTERPEGVTAGASKLIGTDQDRIIAEASYMLDKPRAEIRVTSPYGDGRASRRICSYVLDFFGIPHEREADWIEEHKAVA